MSMQMPAQGPACRGRTRTQQLHHFPVPGEAVGNPADKQKLVHPTRNGLQPKSNGLQPKSDGLQPNSDGLEPTRKVGENGKKD